MFLVGLRGLQSISKWVQTPCRHEFCKNWRRKFSISWKYWSQPGRVRWKGNSILKCVFPNSQTMFGNAISFCEWQKICTGPQNNFLLKSFTFCTMSIIPNMILDFQNINWEFRSFGHQIEMCTANNKQKLKESSCLQST